MLGGTPCRSSLQKDSPPAGGEVQGQGRRLETAPRSPAPQPPGFLRLYLEASPAPAHPEAKAVGIQTGKRTPGGPVAASGPCQSPI